MKPICGERIEKDNPKEFRFDQRIVRKDIRQREK